jgi:hypothetical protein
MMRIIFVACFLIFNWELNFANILNDDMIFSKATTKISSNNISTRSNNNIISSTTRRIINQTTARIKANGRNTTRQSSSNQFNANVNLTNSNRSGRALIEIMSFDAWAVSEKLI